MQTPTSVTVFGVLNIVFGVMGIFGMAMTAVLVFAPPNAALGGGENPFLVQGGIFGAWLKISMVLGSFATIALVISGVGLLRMRPWGHRLAIGYAIYGVASTVLGMAMQLFFVVIPLVQRAAPGSEMNPMMAGAIGGIAGGCIGVIYPALLWYFMTRGRVVAAFAGLGPQPELIAAEEVHDIRPVVDSTNPYASPRAVSALNTAGASSHMGESVAEVFIPSKNSPALASYYLGLFSLFPFLGFPMGVAAVYYGRKGLKNARANPTVRGAVHAWVGIVCGSLFGLFNFLLFVLFMVGLIATLTRR